MRAVALRNMHYGITDERGYASRLKTLAKQIGRTYEAVRMRASRIGAFSYAKCAQYDVVDEIVAKSNGNHVQREDEHNED